MVTENDWYVLGILYVILFIGIVYGIGKAAYNTIKEERKQKKFVNIMTKGDAVYFPVASGNIKGEILEVDGDSVKIIVTITKSRVYPID